MHIQLEVLGEVDVLGVRFSVELLLDRLWGEILVTLNDLEGISLRNNDSVENSFDHV